MRNSTMKWFLAMANQNAPADGRFIGNIDDFRIFNKPITLPISRFTICEKEI